MGRNARKLVVLGFLAGINFNPNNETLGNQFPSKHVIWRKKWCRSMQNRGLQGRAGKKSYKKSKK